MSWGNYHSFQPVWQFKLRTELNWTEQERTVLTSSVPLGSQFCLGAVSPVLSSQKVPKNWTELNFGNTMFLVMVRQEICILWVLMLLWIIPDFWRSLYRNPNLYNLGIQRTKVGVTRKHPSASGPEWSLQPHNCNELYPSNATEPTSTCSKCSGRPWTSLYCKVNTMPLAIPICCKHIAQPVVNVKILGRKPVGSSSMTNQTRVTRSSDESWSTVDSTKALSVVMASLRLDKPSDRIGAWKGGYVT